MSRRHLTWCYLDRECGPAALLSKKALENPGLEFMFADTEDRARVRRQIEAALRTTATDRQLLDIAELLDVRF